MKTLVLIMGMFILVFVSCQNKTVQYSPEALSQHGSFPIIKDTSNYKTTKREAFNLTFSKYKLLYIGKWKDTLYPDYELHYYKNMLTAVSGYNDSDTHRLYPYFAELLVTNRHRTWFKSKMTITVDTNQMMKKNEIRDYADLNSEDSYYDAYPVIIQNKDTDTLCIGGRYYVNLFIEAKDSVGDWRPITKPFVLGCAHSMRSVLLPPDEIGLTSVIVYDGDYYTTLRIATLDSIYSNEFKGRIHYSQFGNTNN